MVVRLVMMRGLGGRHRQIGKSRQLTRVAQYEKRDKHCDKPRRRHDAVRVSHGAEITRRPRRCQEWPPVADSHHFTPA